MNRQSILLFGTVKAFFFSFALLSGLGVLSAVADTSLSHLVDETAVSITEVAPGVRLIDFGRVAVGNLVIVPPPGAMQARDATPAVIHFGEAMRAGRIDRTPPGSLRYARVEVQFDPTGKQLVVAPPADVRNTTPPAVLTPSEWGVILPFRWVEIENWPWPELKPEDLHRQSASAKSWDDTAASFRSSDKLLNQIWDLCHYSIKATTFAGVYVDGDRERISYEADAYLNQLGEYACDGQLALARATFDRLLQYPTWPSEWAPHMIFMAQADWLQSGDKTWLATHYEALKGKLQMERARPDGLLTSNEAQIKKGDLVDWPQGERDGFVLTPVNCVVNAFHLRALEIMADIARSLGHSQDADVFKKSYERTRTAFARAFFDFKRGLYRDGEDTTHASLHANLFALAFHLVPPEQRSNVLAFIKSRGMACSVYAAQYLLEALCENDDADFALNLITAPGDRSWRHMVDSGTTITWEAWDIRYKPNQDWTHAWGAAPINILPRYILGVTPRTPGWTEATIRPNLVGLEECAGKVPTPHGPIDISWHGHAPVKFSITIPDGISAYLELPIVGAGMVTLDRTPWKASRLGHRLIGPEPLKGKHEIEIE